MTVIIANGRFPTHPTPLSYIERASFIVCCDGAANEFIEIGGKPNAIVGDCDSISKENIVRFADILYPNNDQETNDLTKSVQFCVDKGIKDITIVGGTGKREDHTLGNISLLAEYVHIANVVMATNWGIFTPINTTTQFKSFIAPSNFNTIFHTQNNSIIKIFSRYIIFIKHSPNAIIIIFIF